MTTETDMQQKMEDAKGRLYLLLWLDNLLIFDLYNYEKNRREGYMRKAEEALDGSLSMLMTKIAYGR